MERKNTLIMTQVYHATGGGMIPGGFEEKICLCDWYTNPHLKENKQQLMKRLNTSDIQ